MKQAAIALVLVLGAAGSPVLAGPGDVYVPAHRTANGLWVPANVPTSSGGTRMSPTLRAAKPAKPAATHRAMMPPLVVSAESIRR